jgi:hypothetical protein
LVKVLQGRTSAQMRPPQLRLLQMPVPQVSQPGPSALEARVATATVSVSVSVLVLALAKARLRWLPPPPAELGELSPASALSAPTAVLRRSHR